MLSPLINCALSGMPPAASLPAIMVKSVTLVVAAGYIGSHMKFTIWSVVLAVFAYQFVGMAFEFFFDLNIMHTLQDVRIGWPGILIQIVGGYFLIKAIEKW